jgi:DNA-binding LacI/PurR family transcriptional regulator
VGRLAAEILISQVEGEDPDPRPIKRIVRTNLIIRGTTREIK